tara:strand:- start:1440 stop:2291 length:852 start_codon:yes stop_codon:yes gene_type:complete
MFQEKFIAFIDIVGFSRIIERSDADPSELDRALKLIEELLHEKDIDKYSTYGPETCPASLHIEKDLNFQATQISDCVVFSIEKSPAGFINLITHAHSVAMRLMFKGALCRGYITLGNIIHSKNQFLGSGYQNAVKGEQNVTVFSDEKHPKGAPFIQFDAKCIDFLQDLDDKCVKDVFSRITRSDGSYTAIYPFNTLKNIPSTTIDTNFKPEYWREQVEKSLKFLETTFREFDYATQHASDEGEKRKIQHYIDGLNEIKSAQHRKIDRLNRMIETGNIPRGGFI